MKNILVEGMSCMRGGLETFIYTLYKYMDPSKYHFDFLTYDANIPFEEEFVSSGCTVYKVTPRSKNLLQYKKELDEIFSQKKYDIFWSNRTTLSSIQPFKCAKKFKVPITVCHSHGSQNMGSAFTKLMHTLNQRLIGKYVTRKVACSPEAAEWFFKKDRDVIILRNSVDTEAYDYSLEKAIDMKRRNGMEDMYVLGHIGRFSPEKNHSFLLDVFEEVLKREKNSVLLLCGDGILKQDIENSVKERGIESQVKFLGIRNDIIDLLHLFDVFVFPSLFEGLPFVLVEAQAAGLPCVVSSQVSEQSKLTDVLEFVDLTHSAEYWAEKVLEYKDVMRMSKKDQIENAGFAIKNLMKQIDDEIL